MFICIWCEDENRGIGLNNSIPWKIDEDLLLFKKITLNSIVLMGKKTFLSLKKPLKNRRNIVLSRNPKFIEDWRNNNSIEIVSDVDSFIKKYKNVEKKVFIIGGKEIYDIFIEHSKILFVSKIFKSYDCDVFMNNSFDDFDLKDVTFFEDFVFKIYLNKNY